ncbi:MAG: hypothetical protein KJ990_00350 [Proteobacteria bacterium]|nr:hypothetical protein [Pseudomonadota bacterium]MBU1648378.1 hypothetical protein [Pseudomonadota bacterium]
MKRPFLSPDLLLLKWPVLLMVVSVVVSVLWWGGAYKFRENSTLAMQAALANWGQMDTLIRQTKDEEKTIHVYSDRYRHLQTSGVIGDEDRLELVEALGRIRAHHNLYPIQFDIEQQSVLPLQEGESEDAGPSLSLRVSRIQIALALLHEDDLAWLLAELRGVGRGMFVVEECSVSRTGSVVEGEILKLSENLSASCKILWLTLKSEERVAPPLGESGS